MDMFDERYLLLGFIYYVAFLFSTTCHEAAHALVAKLGGDLTAAEGGQVSLNPIPHIRRSPYGMVVFPLLSFFLLHGSMIGFASAPYNPDWARRHPHRSALMALAGPATNFALMLLAALARNRWRVDKDRLGIFYGVLNGVLATVGMLAFYAAMAKGKASVVGPLTALFPLFTVAGAVALLHERLNRVQVAGVVVALAAIAVFAQ